MQEGLRRTIKEKKNKYILIKVYNFLVFSVIIAENNKIKFNEKRGNTRRGASTNARSE